MNSTSYYGALTLGAQNTENKNVGGIQVFQNPFREVSEQKFKDH